MSLIKRTTVFKEHFNSESERKSVNKYFRAHLSSLKLLLHETLKEIVPDETAFPEMLSPFILIFYQTSLILPAPIPGNEKKLTSIFISTLLCYASKG